jgi:hypothetical protein
MCNNMYYVNGYRACANWDIQTCVVSLENSVDVRSER